MWHRVPGKRPARIEAGGSVELRPLQQAPDRRDQREIFRRLLSLLGSGGRVKGSLRRFSPLTRPPLPSPEESGDEKRRAGRREKKHHSELENQAPQRGLGRQPQVAGLKTIHSPKGATAVFLEAWVCRRPFGAV